MAAAGEEGGLGADPDLLRDFAAEATSHLDTAEQNLLLLERNPGDADLINAIFRAVHSVKGTAGFLDLEAIIAVAHEAEAVLDLARRGQLQIAAEVVGTLLEALDRLRSLISALPLLAGGSSAATDSQGQAPAMDIEPVIARLRALHEGHTPPPQRPASQPHPPLGEILVAEGCITREQLDRAIQEQQRPLGQILVERGLVSPQAIEKALERQRALGGGDGPTTVRVDIETVERLIGLVGQALDLQGRLVRRAQGAAPDLGNDLEALRRTLREVERQALAMRRVPVRQLFQRMHRLVRDEAVRSGKRVELVLTGEETEVDRAVIERLSDPLVHLLRNALDHGIETPDERVAHGKSPLGRIALRARRSGDSLCVDVTDDGRGLRRDEIRERAMALGLVQPGASLGARQIDQLVFAPGLTTVARATERSGRGVGMDVVRRTIEALGGRVEISSTPGNGTCVTLWIPVMNRTGA